MRNGRKIALTPGKRVLFLTKDLELIRKQLRGEINLHVDDVAVEDLLDNINTDTMTPAWVCFSWRPEEIAQNAYAGLLDETGKRVFEENDLKDGNFEVIVSGLRKGTGSSRETAVQAEKWAGIRLAIAASFAPIHRQNNINQGQLMGDHALLKRLQEGETLEIEEFTKGQDPITQAIVEAGGLFAYSSQLKSGQIQPPKVSTPKRPMTMAEKILTSHALGDVSYVKPGDALMARVDGGYSHEFTTAQVHAFLGEEFGEDYQLEDPSDFAVFEDHLIYATGVAKMAPYTDKIQELRDMQRAFQAHTGVRDYSAKNGISPGICHQVAREDFLKPGGYYLATDSHTCMGGGSNTLAYGVGTTEYAALAYAGVTPVKVPESIRFELQGSLKQGVTAKDVILEILRTYAKEEATLSRVMEFGGPGLASLSMDERATLANMATECSARTAICEGDSKAAEWIAAHQNQNAAEIASLFVSPDEGAQYDGGVHTIDLSAIEPMVATPGDPTFGATVKDLEKVAIDIAYGGSCTAGKEDDLDFYALVMKEAQSAGLKVADGVSFYIQFGSTKVEAYAAEKGYLDIFQATGVQIIPPGCGACIGCGPGVSTDRDQVTVSAINRNFSGRSGPGSLYLASPLTVAASAVSGKITPYQEGMFQAKA